MRQADGGVCQHDCQSTPDEPAFASISPVINGAWGPAADLRQRRQKCPPAYSPKQHVERGCGSHDDALADVGEARIQGPEPGRHCRGTCNNQVSKLHTMTGFVSYQRWEDFSC